MAAALLTKISMCSPNACTVLSTICFGASMVRRSHWIPIASLPVWDLISEMISSVAILDRSLEYVTDTFKIQSYCLINAPGCACHDDAKNEILVRVFRIASRIARNVSYILPSSVRCWELDAISEYLLIRANVTSGESFTRKITTLE